MSGSVGENYKPLLFQWQCKNCGYLNQPDAKRCFNCRKWRNVNNTTFQIVETRQLHLATIKWLHFKEEGFATPTEFEDCWVSLHPQKGYDGEQMVWVHVFKRIEEAQKT